MNEHTTQHIDPSAFGHAHRSPQVHQAQRWLGARRWYMAILRADGAFLLAAGLAALVADLAGYFFRAGPFAALAGQPLAVGAVEAHGLAALLGLLLIRATPDDHWRWHVVGLAVHLFLGVCNLLFWKVYVLMDATTAGVMSTIAHAMLFSGQLACLALARWGQPAEAPAWLRGARQSGLYVVLSRSARCCWVLGPISP